MNLFVGNVSSESTEEDLRREFGRYGVVSSASLFHTFAAASDRSFALIDMPSEREATAAMRALDRTAMGDSIVRVRRPPVAA